jgi:hypothetical protein
MKARGLKEFQWARKVASGSGLRLAAPRRTEDFQQKLEKNP